MYKVVPFSEQHILPLLEQPINRGLKDFFLSGRARELETSGSVTLMRDGQVLLVGGVLPLWEGRGIVWCMFNEESRNFGVTVFRHLRRYVDLKLKTFRRIEVCVPYDFDHGKRRVEMLGFKLECAHARKYLPDGSDCALYAMVRD
jgi:hypothetical protein